jgi:DNA-binding NarL/FixJ family response regulator
MIRLLLVDDEPMVIAHLRTILGSAEDIDVVGDARDGAEAVEAVLRYQPDVVLMDLRMPEVDGLTATERIAALPHAPVVIALTTFDADAYILRALRAGAAGFVVKSIPPADLIGVVRVAATGQVVLSPAAMRRLLAVSDDGDERNAEAQRRTTGLTEREREVLACLGEGMPNADIAGRLYLSEATVKTYVSRILDKLGCANRTQAGLLARAAGLV